jgi:hypothetical protein
MTEWQLDGVQLVHTWKISSMLVMVDRGLW